MAPSFPRERAFITTQLIEALVLELHVVWVAKSLYGNDVPGHALGKDSITKSVRSGPR